MEETIDVSLELFGLCKVVLPLTLSQLSGFCSLKKSIPVELQGSTVGKLVFVEGRIAKIEEFKRDLFANSLLGATI